MRCFTAFAAAAAGSLLGLPLADARIQGFATPKTIAVGKSFSVLFEGVDYIQTVSEVAAAFGIATEQSAYPGTIGTQVGAAKFSPCKSFSSFPPPPFTCTHPLTRPLPLVLIYSEYTL